MVLGPAVGVALLLLAWFFTMDSESEIRNESAQKVDHNKTLDLNDTSWEEVGSKTWIVPSAGIEMIWCEPGTFMMGSPKSEFGNNPGEIRHKVVITKGFFMSKYEITNEQWVKVLNKDEHLLDSKLKNKPKGGLNHGGAAIFARMLTELEYKSEKLHKGWKFKLPSEAQWEYACRAGTKTAYYWGDYINPALLNFKDNGIGVIDVGTYPPNPWGFHDMHGNIQEWCDDMKVGYGERNHTDPFGVAPGRKWGRNIRGGSAKKSADLCRSATRFGAHSARSSGPGIRLIYQKNY